jgi:hypothetical protein
MQGKNKGIKQSANLSKFLILLFFMVIYGTRSSGQEDPFIAMQKMKHEYLGAKNDSLKVEKLSEMAGLYMDILDEREIADSLGEVAITIAEMSYRPSLIWYALTRYIETNDISNHFNKALGYALKANRLAGSAGDPAREWRSCRNLASVYLDGFQFDKALEWGYKSLSVATTMNKDEWKVESYLLIGRSFEGKNQKIEAFRSYLNAMGIAQQTDVTELMIRCYAAISNFYMYPKYPEKAIYYKLKQRDLISSVSPVDSTALMWTLRDLQDIDVYSNNKGLNNNIMHLIIDFAVRHRNKRLEKFTFALYRSYLFESNNLKQLYSLYHDQYPDQLSKIRAEDTILYYRLNAFFNEYLERSDSANYYMQKAEMLVRSDPNKIFQSKFYYRLGTFLMHHGKTRESIDNFEKSYVLAASVPYLDYMVSASRKLEELYAKTGDYKNAYKYSSLNTILSDSVNNIAKKDQLVLMEINHEVRQQELMAAAQEQKTIRRHNIQYTGFTIGIILIFIMLTMLGSFRVPEWSVRALGFFSFIFLFEFIILIADHKILAITSGEPWKILLIKIGLIAILLPLHEWLEKKLIEYLLSHKLIDLSKFSMPKTIHFITSRFKGEKKHHPHA